MTAVSYGPQTLEQRDSLHTAPALQVLGCFCGPLSPSIVSVLNVESFPGPAVFGASLAEPRACGKLPSLLLGDFRVSPCLCRS